MKETTAGGQLSFNYKGNIQDGVQLIFNSYKMNIPCDLI